MFTPSLINGQTSQVAHPAETVIEIGSDKIPNIDQNSLEFLRKIVQNDLRILEFEDNLNIYSLSGSKIGTFSVSVTPTIHKKTSCFKVKAKSSGSIDGAPCGTEVNAFINEKLVTLDQDYFEFIQLPQGQLDRRVIITLENDKEYSITKTDHTQKELKKSTFRVKRSLMNGYISESSNILLQRLMIQNNMLEQIALFTFDTEVNPCMVTYRALDSRVISLDDEEVKIRGIERTIESISEIPTTWQVYFSSDGHMINRVQIGYPAVMKVAIKPKPIEIDEFMPKLSIPKKELDWDKDMQMNSKYLDRKEELKNEYDQYLHDHPEVKALMADYMQSILSLKPNDVIAFSSKYFAPFSSKTKSNKLLNNLNSPINIPKH